MLFTKFALASTAFLAPFSASALSFTRPDALVLNGESPISVNTRWTWTDCGSPGDVVHIKSIEVSPDPPQPGKDLTVTVNAFADEVIEEGAYADVTVKLGLIKLLKKEFDICQEARSANATIQCPIAAGDHKVVQTVALPKEIPRAKFAVLAQGYSVDDADLMCVKIDIDFMLGHNLCDDPLNPSLTHGLMGFIHQPAPRGPNPVFRFSDSAARPSNPAHSLPTPSCTPPPGAGNPSSRLTIERLAQCEVELADSDTLGRALSALPPRSSGYSLVTLNCEEEDEYIFSARSFGRSEISDACRRLQSNFDDCTAVAVEPPNVTRAPPPPSAQAYLTPPSSPETGPEYDPAHGADVDDMSLDAGSTLVDDYSSDPCSSRELEKYEADENRYEAETEIYDNNSLESNWFGDDGADGWPECDDNAVFDDIEAETEVLIGSAVHDSSPASGYFTGLRKFTTSPVNLPDLTTALDPSSFPQWPVARGGFGEVWKGDIVYNGSKLANTEAPKEEYGSKPRRKAVAVKRLTIYSDAGEGGVRKVLKRTAREIYIWSRLRHRNVLPLLGICTFRGGIGIVSPWQEAGNATAWVNQNPGVDRLELCEGICAGLIYLHDNAVTHGDLRGANVLISPHGTPRLIDFGLATVVGGIPAFSASSTISGTVRWMAPELQVGESQGTTMASDVFAFGMTMLELFTGAPPFSTIRNDVAVLLKYQQGRRPPRPVAAGNRHTRNNTSDERKDTNICAAMD
ncbi:Phosphatidylglycerol/phosphatidylinositol transfer protein, partial [Ceratobasidium sp. 370]